MIKDRNIDGSAASKAIKTLIAGETLSAWKVVAPDSNGKMVTASKATGSQRDIIVGITCFAATLDQPVDVQIFGVMENSTWNWTMGQELYLSTAGDLTQTPPTSGFLLPMGFPLSATKINFRIGQGIVLL